MGPGYGLRPFRENRCGGLGVCGWIKTPRLVFPGGVADPGPIHRSSPPSRRLRRVGMAPGYGLCPFWENRGWGFGSEGQVKGQVAPVGVFCFDQGDLPGAPPALEPAFMGHRLQHIGMVRVPDQTRHPMLAHKGRAHALAMFPHAAHQIIRHPGIERALLPVRQDVDVEIIVAHGARLVQFNRSDQPILFSRTAKPIRDPSTGLVRCRGGSNVSGWVPDMGFAHSGKTGVGGLGVFTSNNSTCFPGRRSRPGTHPPIISTFAAVQRWRDGSRIWASPIPGKQRVGFGGKTGRQRRPHSTPGKLSTTRTRISGKLVTY